MTKTGPWKPSVFNTFHYQDGLYYCFNSISSALFALGPKEYKFFENCLGEIHREGFSPITTILDLLIANAMVVPRANDEYEQEHQRFLNSRDSTQWAFLSIVPTLGCNLNCSYCFQKDIKQISRMSPAICQGVVTLFRELASHVKGIAVIWFGGEPLLTLNTIQHLTQEFQTICGKHGIRYLAEMITNGTLISPQNIKNLKKLKLSKIEISIDGLPHSYSSRKGFPMDKTMEFYHFLINDIEFLLESVGSLILRINVDRENVEEAKDIVRQIKHKSSVVDRIDFRIQLLAEGKGLVKCIPHKCYSPSEASDIELDFKRFLAAEGLLVYGFPRPINHPCMAINKYAFTIDPEGHLGKCVPAVGHADSTFYSITSKSPTNILEELESCRQPYVDYDPFLNKTCSQCPFLPLCLGQCPKDHETANFECHRRKKFQSELEFYNNLDAALLR